MSFSSLESLDLVREKLRISYTYIEVTAEPEQETPVHAAPQGSPPLADHPVSCAGLFQEL